MPDEVTNISEVRTTSDGHVTISVETYNDLLAKAVAKPPVITRTTVIKTAEMASKEYRVWGGTFMGIGAAMFIVGASIYRAGM
jgi:hypothetical protein